MNLVSLVVSLPKSHLRSSWLALRELVAWLVSYIFIFYVFLFTAPFQLYRRFVTVLAKFNDSEITTIVTGLSAIFHRDFDCYNDRPLHTIVACLRIKGGALSYPLLKQAFLEKVVLKKNPKTGQLCYPELQQYFTRFMGYSFLKWDRKFDIKNHVTVYRNENEVLVNRHLLMELWQDLMKKPYPKSTSPWEAVLVENYLADEREEDGDLAPDWIIFVRIHHCIADGFCFEKIIGDLVDSDYVPDFVSLSSSNKLVGQKTVTEQLKSMVVNLRCLLMGPYELLNRGIRFAEGYHTLHFPASAKSNEYFVVESQRIPVEQVKKIKKRLGVGFTTVLLAVACGAIRKYLAMNGMPFPELYTTTIPFPIPGKKRGDRLGNEFYLAGIDLPIDLDTQQARLLHVQNSLENLRHSGFMKMLDIFMKQISNLPSPILRAVSRKSMFSTSYSSLPAPDKIQRGGLGGCDLIEVNFTHGMSSDSMGLAISSITFGGNLRMTLFVERNLMQGCRKRAEQFVECLMEEYRELKILAKIE